MNNTLKLKNVSIFYDLKHGQELTAVNNFTYEFKKNKKYAIVGYSGCGKTSLVKAIVGSLVFDGEIFIDELPIESVPIKDRKISYVSQDITLYRHLTIYDNIVFPLRNSNVDHEEADLKVKEIAKKLNIYYLLTRKPKQISIGQAARVAIAKSLVNKNDILIFDEPFANLDVLHSSRCLKVISEYAKEYGSTLIFITHNIKDILNFADYILVMNDGKLIGEFTPHSFLKSENEVVKNLKEDLSNEKE